MHDNNRNSIIRGITDESKRSTKHYGCLTTRFSVCTMVYNPEQSISGTGTQEETYSAGTTLRTLHMQKQTKTETERQENTQNTCNTERKEKERLLKKDYQAIKSN